MARTAERLDTGHDSMLRRYLRALAAAPGEPRAPSPGHAIRTCPECGDRAVFVLEPEGTWFRCSHCGHYA
jgi:transposase